MPNLRILVGMGKTVITKTGMNAVLESGSLTVCSATVFKIRNQNNKVLGVGMAHRGFETKDIFRKNFKAALIPFGDPRNLRIEPLALQTAPDTIIKDIADSDKSMPKGDHECTRYALAEDMAQVAKIDTSELLKLSEQGPKAGAFANNCTAEVNSNGDVNVSRRKGVMDWARSFFA